MNDAVNASGRSGTSVTSRTASSAETPRMSLAARHVPGEEFAGPAEVSGELTSLRTELRLRAVLQPIDGRIHWYGRLPADASACFAARDRVTVTTAHGSASATLSEQDVWGRLRVAGIGRPPF